MRENGVGGDGGSREFGGNAVWREFGGNGVGGNLEEFWRESWVEGNLEGIGGNGGLNAAFMAERAAGGWSGSVGRKGGQEGQERLFMPREE
eukprot:350066-Chlamydomonas_euryale.AAC.1